MTDLVNHPPHYNSHPSGVECIQITEHQNFCIGNAMKYLWRAGQKGDAIQDLKKARWYIDREIERIAPEEKIKLEPKTKPIISGSNFEFTAELRGATPTHITIFNGHRKIEIAKDAILKFQNEHCGRKVSIRVPVGYASHMELWK